MKKIVVLFGGLIFCFFLFCSHRFVLKDADLTSDPAWRSFRGDLRNSGYIQDKIPIPERLLWKLELNGGVRSTPVVAEDVVIIGGMDRKLYFVDAGTGKKLDELSLKNTYPSFLLIEDGFVYLSAQGEKGTLFCFNLKKGGLDWKKELGSSRSSPLIKDDKIFLGTESGKFYALNKSLGETVWQFDAKCKILSSPAYSEGLLYFGLDDGRFYALVEKTGGVRWEFKADKSIHSSAAVQDDKVLFGSLDGKVYCLDRNDGSKLWEFKTSGSIYSSPAVTESSVFIGSNDGFLYNIDLLSGGLIWIFETPSPIHSSPLVVADKVFFGALDGKFYVLDRWRGKVLWSYQTNGTISSSPAVYKEKIYIGSEDGYLYCFGK
jgi:outer membrane protein assembly factor BamB